MHAELHRNTSLLLAHASLRRSSLSYVIDEPEKITSDRKPPIPPDKSFYREMGEVGSWNVEEAECLEVKLRKLGLKFEFAMREISRGEKKMADVRGTT